MPLFFFVFGAILVDAGYLGNATPLFAQLKSDVSGFLAFGVAILILGAIGISADFRPVSKALLVLVFVVFLLANKAKNAKAIIGNTVSTSETGSTSNTASANPSAATDSTSSSSSSSGNADTYAEIIAEFFA